MNQDREVVVKIEGYIDDQEALFPHHYHLYLVVIVIDFDLNWQNFSGMKI